MSNVYAKDRGITHMEFYKVACTARKEISHFLMNDKNIPKKWRSVATYPIINMLNAMLDCIIDANDIIPYKPELVADRKELQRICIRYCDKIFERFQYIQDVILYNTLSCDETSKERQRLEYHLDIIGNLLSDERALLTRWRNSTKLVNRK